MEGSAPASNNAAAVPPAEGNRGGRGRGRGGPRGRGRGDGSRSGGRGRGRGGNQSTRNPPGPANEVSKPLEPGKVPAFKAKNDRQDAATDDDNAEVCFICANPISHHSITPCNHLTCHICSLRMRALYKDKNCPHCRTSAPFVIFTDDAKKRFEEYSSSEITTTDDNIGIKYTSEDIVGDTVLLLRYNCPDPDCDFAGLGWPDLHRHVRSVHHKKMCDLCTRNKKVFTHEHEMYGDKELGEHMRHGDSKPGATTGFKGHPLCGFCGERFYDDDKLYEHCRNKHERCFICDRRDPRQPHYYLDYNALESHFKEDHFICLDRECLEKKFVVFESEVDLKAHQLTEHGSSLPKDVRRDARTVDMSNFDFRQSYQQERRGGASGREQRGRRHPDPNADPLPVSSAQPLRRDELAFQRQMAINSGQAGASRPNPPPPSRPNANAPSQSSQPSRIPVDQPMVDAMQNITISDLGLLTPEQRASLTRHGAVIERASNLLGNDRSKVDTFRSYISNYNKGSMTADQVISAFFSLCSETSWNALGTLVREVADLFDDKKKGEVLRKAWQNRRAVNEDYPSLPGLGGMRGATTSTSGWAAAAAATPTPGQANAANAAAQARHSTRVLKLKNSTRRGSSGSIVSIGAGSTASSADYNRPNDSASAFPALPGAESASRSAQPSWTGGVTTSTPRPAPTSTAFAGATRPGPASTSSREAFPALPAAPKPQMTMFGYGRGAVRRDFNASRDTGFSWGGNPSGSGAGADTNPTPAAETDGTTGKGKKNKKQVLAHWG
ncbi:E3 ubiquitin-protein ligase hel2 [Echria macrotheca]|uniref:RING-type E3 ubiquitin transferase n=1 Tax=Echria macrotheca TaxID=438768 RepID=A0AAJ0B809_9PEZI|nr:E3 ubiquitin-protein ligase hel2 [Echria macrotheca]